MRPSMAPDRSRRTVTSTVRPVGDRRLLRFVEAARIRSLRLTARLYEPAAKIREVEAAVDIVSICRETWTYGRFGPSVRCEWDPRD